MKTILPEVMKAIVIGVGATMVMDLWNLFQKRAFDVPSLNYGFLGRWVLHMPEGTFRHASIAAASPKRFEGAAGWIVHYTIGITLAVVFVWLVGESWLDRPTVIPALTWGIVTVVFPFFLMQPALGFGVASSKAPRPWFARLKSLGTHTVFGLALYLIATLFR